MASSIPFRCLKIEANNSLARENISAITSFSTAQKVRWRTLKRTSYAEFWKYFLLLCPPYWNYVKKQTFLFARLFCARTNSLWHSEQVTRNESDAPERLGTRRTVVFSFYSLFMVIAWGGRRICIGNSMINISDIWHKYHEWYFKIVIRNFTSR